MKVEEGVLYVNSAWNTRQVREVAADLVFSSREVIVSLLPGIRNLEEYDPHFDPDEITEDVHRVFSLDHVPVKQKERWDTSERWAYRFIADFSFRNTKSKLDQRISQSRTLVRYFTSASQVAEYWEAVVDNMDRRLERLSGNQVSNSLAAINVSYIDSRALRFAAQGFYLVPHGSFVD